MEHRRIIKQGAIVFATHEDGSIDPIGSFSQGLFVGDTRFLSHFKIYLNGLKPQLMGSSEEELHRSGFLHTNPDLTGVPARSIGVAQRNSIEDGVVTIWLLLSNRTVQQVDFDLSIELDADFYDSFETRGVKRQKRGRTFDVETTNSSLKMQYVGLDGARRSTQVEIDPAMDRMENDRLIFPVSLGPDAISTITLKITCETQL